MSTSTIPWEQYQQLPPDKRRRPLTPAEYAALTPDQLAAMGLGDRQDGAPLDFNGPVFPNPDHVTPQLDTDPLPATRLPEGASFHRDTWNGAALPADLSNPAAADVMPAMGREVAAKMADPIKLPPGATLEAAPSSSDGMKLPPGAAIDTAAPPAAADKEEPGALDREIPLDSYTNATLSGLQSIARGTRDAVKGSIALLDPRTHGDEEEALANTNVNGMNGRAALPVYRILRSLGHTAKDATQIVGAIHDINNSPDPVGTYAKVAQETAGQGAGQAIVALATEGAGRAVPKIVDVARTGTTANRVARTVGKTGVDALTDVPILRKLTKIKENWEATAAKPAPTPKPAAELDATAENEPFAGGEDEPKPAKPLDATAENKPFAGGLDEPPAPKAPKVRDATGENQPFAGGEDEYTPPVPKKPAARAAAPKRTIVKDPATGQPEFSDVVAAKQAAQPAPAPAVQQNAVQTPPAAAVEPVAAAAEPAPPAPAAGGEMLDRLRGHAAEIQAKEAAAPAAAEEPDLVKQLEDSIAMVRARKAAAASGAGAKGGVTTTAEPKALLDRWGVDPESFTEGRSQTRGLSPQESAAQIQKLTKAYKEGKPVEPVLETRDADNNIVDVDGRGRALAAHRAGVERIPIIVRRMKQQ